MAGPRRMSVTTLLGPGADQLPQLCVPIVNATLVHTVMQSRHSATSSTPAHKAYSDVCFLQRIAGVTIVLGIPLVCDSVLVGAIQVGFSGRLNLHRTKVRPACVRVLLSCNALQSCLLSCDSVCLPVRFRGGFSGRVNLHSTKVRPACIRVLLACNAF